MGSSCARASPVVGAVSADRRPACSLWSLVWTDAPEGTRSPALPGQPFLGLQGRPQSPSLSGVLQCGCCHPQEAPLTSPIASSPPAQGFRSNRSPSSEPHDCYLQTSTGLADLPSRRARSPLKPPNSAFHSPALGPPCIQR